MCNLICGIQPLVNFKPFPVMQTMFIRLYFPRIGVKNELQVEVGTNTIRLWDSDTGQLKKTLSGHTDMDSLSVAFSPDGQSTSCEWKCGTIRFVDGMLTLDNSTKSYPLLWVRSIQLHLVQMVTHSRVEVESGDIRLMGRMTGELIANPSGAYPWVL